MRLIPELLAPVGAWESLAAATAGGADAVYLGGKLFSARASAGNFDRQELELALRYAHVRGVKVYVTVNTLLSDEELPEALNFLYDLQQIGADAVIVQDLGLIRLARQSLPELPLFASTQMTVHNRATALFLSGCGVKRLVLARETPLAGIRDIVRLGDIETEIFVHGALCFCYSGQCLMSSMIGGRSGNRGRCAQPCRLRYALLAEDGASLSDPKIIGEHLLSPRDLNLSQHLPELCKAGITSLKIEGRLKRPEYVATVVRIYRDLLDRIADGAGEYTVYPEETRDLEQIFNRGFTAGYLFQNPGRELMSYKRPNNRGIFLGRIRGFHKDSQMAEMLLEQPLRKGDGVEVWLTQRGRAAGKVNRIYRGGRLVDQAAAGEIILLDLPGRVFPGDRVFKTHDSLLIQKARETYAPGKEHKKIPLTFRASVSPGEPFRLKVTDPSGNTAEAVAKTPGQIADKSPLTEDFLRRQLGRLGNTPFTIGELFCHLPEPVITPVREINEARRQALESLEEQRTVAARHTEPVAWAEFQQRLASPSFVKPNDANAGIIRPAKSLKAPYLSVAVTDLPSLEAAVAGGADIVYFGGDCYRSKETIALPTIQTAGEICRAAGTKLALSTPRIMQDREMDWFFSLLEDAGAYIDGVLAANLGQLKQLTELYDILVYGDISLNVFNRESAIFLLEAGIDQVTLSPELTLEQISRLSPALPVAAEVLVHGMIPVMVSEHCPPGSVLGGPGDCGRPCAGKKFGLKDRKDIVFPLEMDQFCRMQLFNSRDLCLIDDIAPIAATGVATLRIEARPASPQYVGATVKAYRAALNQLPANPDPRWLAETKARLAKHSPAGFTKGHYYRGV